MNSIEVNGKKYILAESDGLQTQGLVNITAQGKSEIDKLLSSFETSVVSCLKEAKAILAGGALTSLYTNKDVNDYDIYFKSVEGFQSLVNDIYNTPSSSGDLGSHDLIVNFATNRSILCKEQGSGNEIQLIVYKMFPQIEDIFNAFDFTINMCAYDFETGQMWAHPDFLKHCSQRYLSFNDGTDYPVVSALRVQKYVDRGYTISKSEMLRILFTIAGKKYNSWEDIKDEVGSMYGIPIDELFDETKEFSIKEAVDQLSKTNKLDKPVIFAQSYDTEELHKKFPKLLDIEWIKSNDFWWAKENAISADDLF